ncbi:hypothetical protein HD598_000176 [Neomicrococcus aestuarii]|uniref:Capsular biosynthesis protein n=1 Tax=Neomicrococcus aestuarii TaxID=556325 RepID=A0A7W8X096_9MICC|nr:hypothetical protein [Neomicrococcus aestuarii]MBB5511489.1 hypothetical protein [Neomicrococcus aestuarii]
MTAIANIKKIKHQLFLGKKKAKFLAEELRDTGYRLRSKFVDFQFDASNYPLDFTALPSTHDPSVKSGFPHRIWCAWFGEQEMSDNRRSCYESILAQNSDLDVQLVTYQNLDTFIVEGSPLHPAFRLLSAVHQSDYIHAYLMHHHGGGFTGIKKHPVPWRDSFEAFEKETDAWIAGYRLPRVSEATYFPGELARDIHRNYSRLIGFSGKLVRSNTPLTHDWFHEVNRRVSYYQDLLEQFPGDAYGTTDGYPVPWTRIGSQVFEPLCLKYNTHLRIDNRLKPQLWGHR